MARSYAMQSICRAPTSPQHCLCRLAAEIGFEPAAVERFVLRQRIATFAPHHPTVGFRRNSGSGAGISNIVTRVGFVAKTAMAMEGKGIDTEVCKLLLLILHMMVVTVSSDLVPAYHLLPCTRSCRGKTLILVTSWPCAG